MEALYPEIEPYDHGMLEVGDGNRIYWETCGNPEGKPALVLHGGPGSGYTPRARRYFDPDAYRIVLLDQRQCGRSTPHASDASTDLSTNTTEHLLSDIEALREHLGIDRWLLQGGSWGSTLALAYAERHPDRVSAVVLAAVTMTRTAEIDWLYHGVGQYFPEAWSRFRDGVPADERNGDLVAAYYRLLQSPDAGVRERAAYDWCRWEDAVVAGADAAPSAVGFASPRYEDRRFRMAFARIVTHYFHHGAWLADGALLRSADRLAGIPGVLIHGRHDLGTPLVVAYELHRAWPSSQLVIVGSGHSSAEQPMTDALLEATRRLAATA